MIFCLLPLPITSQHTTTTAASFPKTMAVVLWFRALFTLVLVLGARAIDDTCIKCLCEAINEGPTCSYLVGCHDGVCGPYAITMPYWVDGGRPTVGLDDRNQVSTYEKCAIDVTCAEATIRGYMDKFHQDCNQDGYEDCFDFAAVHFHGGYNCNKPLRVPVRNALQNCLARSGSPPPEPYPQPDYPVPQPDNPVPQPEQSTPFPEIDIRFGDKDK